MLEDLEWMYKSVRAQYRGKASESLARLLKAARGDIRIRTRRRGCASIFLMLIISLFVLSIGMSVDAGYGATRLICFGLGTSILIYFLLHILDDFIERAWVAYMLIPLPALPIFVVLLIAGLSVSRLLNDHQPLVVFGVVLIISLTHVPVQLKRRIAELRIEFERGFLRSAYEARTGTWNSVFDLDEHINYRVPWIWIILDVIAPALGMQISRHLGPRDDLYLVAYSTLFFGYMFFRPLLIEAIARASLIRQLEDEFNAPILLKPLEFDRVSP